MKTLLLQAGVIVLGGFVLASCSSGPKPPEPGTPAFYWSGAQTTYRAGDMVRADENLQHITKTDNEFAVRARPWAIIVSAGIAKGYVDAANAFDTGAKANRANPMPFRREASSLRSMASASALEFADTVHQFMAKDKDENVPLAFEYPTGSPSQSPAVAKISGGVMVQEAERDALVKAEIQRGVLLTLSKLAGNGEDTAKTLEMMKTPDVRIPRATFLMAAAKLLFDQSDLFSGTKLDRPDRLKLLCQEAQELLQALPESKETKELNGKIQAALKKIRVT